MLDTNICIYIRQRRPQEVLQRFQKLRPGEAALSVITYGELLYGAAKSQQRLAALERLVTDRAHYEELSRRSAGAALAYADRLNALAFESYLEKVVRSGRQRHRAAQAHHPRSSALPEKQRLLASRLRRRPRE